MRYLLPIIGLLIAAYILNNLATYEICYATHRARGYAMFRSRDAIWQDCRYHLTWPIGY